MRKRFLLFLVIILLLCGTCPLAQAWERNAGWDVRGDLEMGTDSIDGDSSTGIYFDPDNDNTNEVTIDTDGNISVDGLTMDEDELLTWVPGATPNETIHWDSTTHDFHFSDDGYFEDIHPGLYILCTDNRRAFGWHYHYGEAYPLSFNTGIHNGTEIVLSSGVPLMSSDNDGTNIRFPKGIGGNTVCTGTFEAKVAVTLDTASAITLAADDCKSGIRVNNDNDVIDYTLPDAATGLSVVVQSMFAAVVTIDCYDTNESIVLDGTTLTAGNAIDSPGTAGDYVLLVAISSTQWVVMGRSGAWVDGGAD